MDWKNYWHPVRYATVSGIIRAIRATWNNSKFREADALKRFTQPHFLVIDEVGRQFGTDEEKMQIEELLDMRYQEKLPTLVCTNVDKSQLANFLGERGLTGCAKTAESWPYAIGRVTGERKRTDHLDINLICGSLTRR